VKHLSKLTPAETLIILKDKDTRLKEVLKVTLMDLLLKQVLKIEEVYKQTGRTNEQRLYEYVETGKNFRFYNSLPHENVFLEIFQKNEDYRYLFRHVVKVGYENAKSYNYFHKLIRKSRNISDCFNENFIFNFIGFSFKTSKHEQLRRELQKEIDQLELLLPSIIQNDKEKALEILKEIKGNIFLISTIEFDLLKQIDQTISTEMNRQTDNSFGCSGCSWTYFESYSESFDSSCSSDSGSSDGGCSGCSGCGGCGGD
jgi:hypothetical protein